MVRIAELVVRGLLAPLRSPIGAAALLLLTTGSWLSLIPMAAALTITAETVTVSRADASNVFDLRRDAVSPVGEGDTITTGTRGRAWVDLEGGARLLLMPQSRLEILSFQWEDTAARLVVDLDGHLIAKPGDASVVIEIDAEYIKVQPDGLTAIWTDFEGGDIVTVATGTAHFADATGSEHTLQTGQGLYVDDQASTVTQLSETAVFLHAAQLVGIWRGCPGIVVNTGTENLNLRVGPGLESLPIGYTPPGGGVKVLGISESGNWYRVQRLHGFGWMRGYYLDFGCPDDFPTYPNNQVERNLELRDLQPDEYALLVPFYGPTDINVWIYRSFRESPYAEPAQP